MTALVALDVDGTLLSTEGLLPAEHAAAVRELQQAGVAVSLLTGKTWPSVEWLWRELDLPGAHVCCNGSVVVRSDGSVVFAEVLADETVQTVVSEDEEGPLRALPLDGVRVQRTGVHFLEWNPPTVSKGTGLRIIADLAGCALDDTVAVGDAENDIPMFSAAGRSVAVASAPPVVARNADVHLAGETLAEFLRSLIRKDFR